MTPKSVFLATGLAAAAILPLPARATLVCEADVVSLDFGMIAGRDGLTQQTSGPVTILCSGGTPGATVRACVTIGPGSGGSGPGNSPRRMTGSGTTPLDFQLTTGNSLSAGGILWETVGYAIALDASGSATIAPTLYAEVTSIGALAIVGTYGSRFDSGPGVAMSFGESDCTQSGAASTFTVSAVVTASCSVSVADMDFGVIDTALTAPVDQTSSIAVSCTNAAPYTIGLGPGRQPADGGPSGRRMANGGNLLAYGLYHDHARTSEWGIGPSVATGTGTGGQQSLTVFGRIFPGQRPSVGIYSDSVVVTVTY